MKPKLGLKERLFCYYYCKLYNPKEAGVKAGFNYISAEKQALKLLQTKAIQKQIRVLKNDRIDAPAELSQSMLERSIAGSINDSVKLLLFHEAFTEEDIMQLDLFAVEKIKKSKDGGFEIQFIDRLRAVEILLAAEKTSHNKDQAQGFYSALEKGALAMNKDVSMHAF